MTIKHTFFSLLLLILLVAPSLAFASSTQTNGVSIDESSLYSESTKPKISGTAMDIKTFKMSISKENSTKSLYKKTIKVKNEEWNTKISKKLPNGTYTVTLYGSKGIKKDMLLTETLIIDTEGKHTVVSDTTFVVEALPLLTGGTARANASVPLAYLQVTNIGKDSGTLKGFWLKQNGSASTQSVVSLSTVDDTGTLRATTDQSQGLSPFKNNLAFVPTATIVLAPGQMKLFTIKANMSNKVDSYIGTNLIIDVTSAEISANVKTKFPIKGTTWQIGR